MMDIYEVAQRGDVELIHSGDWWMDYLDHGLMTDDPDSIPAAPLNDMAHRNYEAIARVQYDYEGQTDESY